MTRDDAYSDRARQIAEAGRSLAARNMTPATSSNFSMRLGPDTAAITISGRDKGKLGERDIMVVDFRGRPVGSEHRPSAETLLHTQLYARFPEVGAVLHTHSLAQTVSSRLYARSGSIKFENYELLKAFAGNQTHEAAVDLPVFANTQDMVALAREVDAMFERGACVWGYLIEGHGIYTWGRDMAETMRHLDAFEFLLQCELETLRLTGCTPSARNA